MKKILSLLSLLMLCVMGVSAQTALIDYPTSKDGTTISGTTTEGTVKIHTNKDAVACYSLKNGYTTDGVMNGNHIKLTLEGGFKKGDVVTIAGAINNSDATKRATAVLFSADAEEKTATMIFTFADFINGRLVADDPVEEIYTLEADYDALYLGRDGGTAANLTLIKVERKTVTNKTVLLVPGPWNADGATYAAYAFNSDEDNAWFPFAEAGGSFATQVTDNFASLILVRMKPATDATFSDVNGGLNWDNKWNQTDDIDFTAVADQTIFTITGFNDSPNSNSGYTTANPLEEAREKLNKVIALAEMLDADALAAEIAAAKEAAAGTDPEAMQTAMTAIMAKALPIASEVMDLGKEFAQKYGYPEVTEAIDAVQSAIPAAMMGGNMDPIIEAVNNLVAKAIPAAQDAIGKFESYAEVLDDAALNTAVANAKAALATGKIKDIINSIKAAEEPFLTAAQNFVAKVKAENIEDAAVSDALAAVETAMGAETPSIVEIGDAVKKLIDAYNAYQLEQHPVYTVAGTANLTGYDWDTTQNEMKLNEETGLYEWTAKFITVTATEQPEFKVVKNYKDWYPADGNWIITPTYLGGEGVYSTITITFNPETTEIGVAGVKREDPVFAANNVYYWESPDGYQDQNGGVAVHNNGARVNYAQAGYYTICLNGKNDYSTDVITITLDEGNTLKAGDEIAITAFRNKDAAEKTSGAKLKFDDGSTITTGDGSEFVNINEAVADTDEYGTEPNTVTIVVPESGEGSKTITLTRSFTGTNLFITKIDVTRPEPAVPTEVTIDMTDAIDNDGDGFIKTFSCQYDLDFTDVEGIKAYTATKNYVEDSYYGEKYLDNVTLSPINVVPAGTGVVLKSEAATTYTVPVPADLFIEEFVNELVVAESDIDLKDAITANTWNEFIAGPAELAKGTIVTGIDWETYSYIYGQAVGFFPYAVPSAAGESFIKAGEVYLNIAEGEWDEYGAGYVKLIFADMAVATFNNIGELVAQPVQENGDGAPATLNMQYTADVKWTNGSYALVEDYTGGVVLQLPEGVTVQAGDILSGSYTGNYVNILFPQLLNSALTKPADLMVLDNMGAPEPLAVSLEEAFENTMKYVKVDGLKVNVNTGDYYFENADGTEVYVNDAFGVFEPYAEAKNVNVTGFAFIIPDGSPILEAYPDYPQYEFVPLAIEVVEEPAPYYLVGTMTNWTVDESLNLVKNTEADGEEYMITVDLDADAQFKIVKAEGDTQTWYPDGTGNAYGENGELTQAGNYTIYFRPNADGNDDWFHNVIYVHNNTSVGINAATIADSNAVVYNLQGVRVKDVKRGGLYIVNGKKQLVK